ncbi:MAG: histidine phosphatase family protein [Actinomycetota bacterium]
MSARLWLVRHGATDWSEAGRFTGWRDIPLNDVGRRQAELLRGRVRATEFDGIWSSDLSRAMETARIAVGGARADERLRELDFGELEGRTWDQCPHDVQAGLLAFDDFAALRGESVGELRDRVRAFIDTLPDGNHLVVTHGGVIRILLRVVGRDGRVPPGGLMQLVRVGSALLSVEGGLEPELHEPRGGS